MRLVDYFGMTSFQDVIWRRITTMCVSYLVAQWKCLHYVISLTDFECVLHLHAGMTIHKHVMASGGSPHSKSLFEFKIKMLCTYSITRHTAEFTSQISGLWYASEWGCYQCLCSLITSPALHCYIHFLCGMEVRKIQPSIMLYRLTSCHHNNTVIWWWK